MNLKKFILKKRFWFSFLLFFIIAPFIILAADEWDFYDIIPGDVNKRIYQRQSDNVSVSNKAVCVDASDSAHSYFLGNKTKTEIESFFTTYYSDPSKFRGVTIRTGCCVDGVCDGDSGESCSTCAEDCGPCASPCTGTITDDRDGKSYPIVTVGEQCWLGANLNVGTMINSASSPSNNATIEKYCYTSDSSKCTTYGGLYSWNEAMQYSNVEKSQGICPSGWHIPTQDEWNTLFTEVGGTNGAGAKLKSVGYTYWMQPNPASDNYNFNVRGAGYHQTVGNFYAIGAYAYFLTSTYSSNSILISGFSKDTENASISNQPSNISVSVRCVRNAKATLPNYTLNYSAAAGGSITGQSSQTVAAEGSGTTVTAVPNAGYKFLNWSDGLNINPRTDINVTKNISVTANFINTCPITFTDSRDGTVYYAKFMAGKCWMVVNLKYLPTIQYTSDSSNSAAKYYVYDYVPTWFNTPDVSEAKENPNYGYFGVLYNWTAASTACPKGWRLPSNGEIYLNQGNNLQELAGTYNTHLKSHNIPRVAAVFWTGTNESGEGDDSTTFSALPSGFYTASTMESLRFQNKGIRAYFWGSTECKLTTGCVTNNSQAHVMYKMGDGTFTDFWWNQNGLSVRCVKE